jgi:hypothetical protein
LTVFAVWVGPTELLTLPLGFEKGSIGVRRAEGESYVKAHIAVNGNGLIAIGDEINSIIYLFDGNGKFLSEIRPQVILGDYSWPIRLFFSDNEKIVATSGYLHQIYGLDGDLVSRIDFEKSVVVGTLPGGDIIIKADKYYIYANNGVFKEASQSLTSILGNIEYIKQIDNLKIFKFQTEKSQVIFTVPLGNIDSYFSDQKNNISIEFRSDIDRSVFLIDPCGNLLGSVILPQEILGPAIMDLPPGADVPQPVLQEIGPVYFGLDGNVYTWKRTPDTYSILKWTWVDSPDDPQPGPDAPTNLTVQPSIDGLYLTWGASPQDPGCVDGYEVERSTSAGGIYTSVKTTDPGVLKFHDTGALPGSTYFYKVRAKSGSTYSPYTAEMSGTR